MWSKTKKALDDRLAASLKKRVRYGCEVYTTKKIKWCSDMPVFYIYVDGEMWLATNLMYSYDESIAHDELMAQCPDSMDYWEKFHATEREAKIMGFRKHGRISMEELMRHIHHFLNELNINEAFGGGDYMYLILAVMDRRVGKRRIRALVDKMEEYPEWMQKWIRLRAEAENIRTGR